MRIPRDVGAKELIRALQRLGYTIRRQDGSHIRLTTTIGGEHHITVPAHQPIKVGTLSTLLKDVAAHHAISVDQLISDYL